MLRLHCFNDSLRLYLFIAKALDTKCFSDDVTLFGRIVISKISSILVMNTRKLFSNEPIATGPNIKI